MLGWVFFCIAFVGLAIASYTDLKSRIVPDSLSYSLIVLGLSGHALEALLASDHWLFLNSIIVAGVFFVISYAMFYFGLLGGGDVKLFAGLGALLPNSQTAGLPAPWPFPLTLLLNSLFCGGVLGLITILYFARKKNVLNEFKKIKYPLLFTPIIWLFGYVISGLVLAMLLLLLTIFGLLLIPLKRIENKIFIKEISPEKLEEGDWAFEIKKIGFKPKRYGLRKTDIAFLQQAARKGLINKVKVREGIPFVPALFVGLVLSYFVGDLFWLVFRLAL